MIVLRKIFVILISAAVHPGASGQSLFYPYTPVNILSARYCQKFHNALVAASNPATTTYIHSLEAGVYAGKKYMTDINTLMVAAAMSFDNNGAGLLFQYAGIPEYSERTVGVFCGKRLGKMNIGIGLNYINIVARGQGSARFLQTVVSSILNFTDDVATSVRIFNPNFFMSPKENSLRPASAFSFGFGWQASPQVYAGIETLKEEKQSLAVIFNLQYEFTGTISSSLTWSTAGNEPQVSIGWKQKAIKIEAGGGYHAALGVSPFVSFLYQKGKTPEK
ncbi:MAG: hypothetical protein JNK79_16085 [Chitinophagaceae bacterium]|nr:hypothetical protein [Chitinophagaceae bacterium]